MRRREGKERGGEIEVMKTQACREEQGNGGGTEGARRKSRRKMIDGVHWAVVEVVAERGRVG